MPIVLREVIGDTGTTQRYADSDLNNTIITAAYLVATMVSSRTTFSIDVENQVIDPDPTMPPYDDSSFSNLIIMKAAVMILMAEVRRYGQQAIAIRDGTSAIDLKRDLNALQKLADGYAKEFNTAVMYYQRDISFSGRVIISPYKTLLDTIDRTYFYGPRTCRY